VWFPFERGLIDPIGRKLKRKIRAHKVHCSSLSSSGRSLSLRESEGKGGGKKKKEKGKERKPTVQEYK
jgi:hypothetical protein